MIIEKSSVNMASSHEAERVTTRSESLRAWVEETSADGSAVVRAEVNSSSDMVEISAQYSQSAAVSSSAAVEEDGILDDAEVWAVDAKLGMMKQIIEYMMGRRIELTDVRAAVAEGEREASERAQAASLREGEGGEVERQGWGVALDVEEVRVERESTRFEASGVVQTSDGVIAFETEIAMSRERIDIDRFSLRAGDAKLVDPLVVNFAGTTAQLTDAKFGFDLNVDGEEEQISFVKSGSGFLVLDKNGDGVVNNGSELFGPTTGDGFAELADYDEDGDGWIDEQDSVFSRLMVWTKDASGASRLQGLLSLNVGAIYTGSASTPFTLEGGDTAADGVVKSTGVYLEEDGSGVGTVQQVDLVT